MKVIQTFTDISGKYRVLIELDSGVVEMLKFPKRVTNAVALAEMKKNEEANAIAQQQIAELNKPKEQINGTTE